MPQHAAADAGVRLDADPRGVRPAQVQWYGVAGQRGAGGWIDQQRGVVTRDVFNDPRKQFPLISDGFMVVYDVPRDGGVVNGSFSVTFERCVDFGCGRTVFGDFKAKVQ